MQLIFLKCLVFLWSSAEVDEPHIKSGSVTETDNIKYTPRGYEKVYYQWRHWGIRPGISSRSKMAWESKERRLACVYIMIGGGVRVSIAEHWKGLAWLEFPTGTKGRSTLAFSSAYTDVAHKEKKEGWDLKDAAVKHQK